MIFTPPEVLGELLESRNVTRQFKPLLTAANLPICGFMISGSTGPGLCRVVA
jgi:hypothetical protein